MGAHNGSNAGVGDPRRDRFVSKDYGRNLIRRRATDLPHGRKGVSQESEGRWQHRPSCRPRLIFLVAGFAPREACEVRDDLAARSDETNFRASAVACLQPSCGLSSFGGKRDPERF